MPNTYAHYRFGQEVLMELSPVIRQAIEENIDIFNIGVHGPDIYSFYHALLNDKRNKLCSREHANPCLDLMQYAAAVMQKDTKNKKTMKEKMTASQKSLVYMYGVICHFALDGYCHGFVNHTRDTTELAHNLMESEFDRMLMLMDGRNPFSYCPGNTLVSKKEYADAIAHVSPEADSVTVLRSVRRMRKWCNFYVAPTVFHRVIIYFGLVVSFNYKKRSGMIMKYKENKKCADTNKELFRLYCKAKKLAISLIEEYAENVFANKKYAKVYQECFSPQTSIEKKLDESQEFA